ncbi:MAG: hypothetical protein JMDDDDMK_02940 [Acidobacteria bacterium]|nr:hypothetical protein [Acidobacteriota bacterium]
MSKLRQFSLLSLLLFLCVSGSITIANSISPLPQSPNKRLERERERIYVREQFSKNFRDLQLTGKALLRDHEAAKLTPGNLAKGAKTINKCARTLRALIALGDMASESPINREIDTAREFDDAIRKLASLIWDFAHNPVHQSNKVFDTDLAERAQTDLLTIINLSKALENKSRGYVSDSHQGNK